MSGCDNGGPKQKGGNIFLFLKSEKNDGRRGFWTGGNVLQISRNTFYDRKN
jgi:hypothetical protein